MPCLTIKSLAFCTIYYLLNESSFSAVAENADKFIIKKQTLHLTLSFKCSVFILYRGLILIYYYGRNDLVFDGRDRFEIELNELEKASVMVFRQGKIDHFQPNEKLLAF